MEALLSTDKVCELLGVTSSFLKKRIEDGTLRCVRLGANRLMRFRESNIESFVESRLGKKFSSEKPRRAA